MPHCKPAFWGKSGLRTSRPGNHLYNQPGRTGRTCPQSKRNSDPDSAGALHFSLTIIKKAKAGAAFTVALAFLKIFTRRAGAVSCQKLGSPAAFSFFAVQRCPYSAVHPLAQLQQIGLLLGEAVKGQVLLQAGQGPVTACQLFQRQQGAIV